MRVRAFAALLAAAALLAGCGGGSGVRDFAAVEVGKTVVSVAADGRSAVVHLRTDPATICAIAYGTTPALGSIANDPGMGGHAISDHTVVLGGLEPNTTYRYRLTATDAAGRVYQTPALATFTTTPHESAAAKDIAVGAQVVGVSSQYSSDYRGANAVDGNPASEWSSAGDGSHARIEIDLGAERTVGGVAFLTREMSDGSAITRTFAVVVDGGKRYGPFPAGTRADPRVAKVAFTGRRLRFEVVRSTGGNTGAAEVEVFAG